MKKTVYVVGGDMRQLQLARLLEEEGCNVLTMALSEEKPELGGLLNADIVIFPIPVSGDGIYINTPLAKEKLLLTDVLGYLRKDCFVLGACISQEVGNLLSDMGLSYIDYYKREELIIKNAIPTAEGALEIALAEMPITLSGCRALVTGYGRVGKIMAEKLKVLGSRVTVSARKLSDFALIEAAGMKYIHTGELSEFVSDFDLIINTVPHRIFGEDTLSGIRGDALLIDLASKPGGVDMDAAKRLGKNVIWALSLPGKCAPITSGEIIKDAIMNIISETEV